MTRYVVVGAGAIGAVLAAELHLAARDVLLVARGAHRDALRTGLRLLRPDGEHRVAVPVAAPDEVDLHVDDVLVLATKAQDAEAALAAWAWRPVAGTDRAAAEVLPVVTLQNGLDTGRVALRRFALVYDAVVLSPAAYVAPGEVESPADPTVAVVWLGRVPAGSDEGAHRIAADLRAARHAVAVVADVARHKAGKLPFVLGNALDALYPAGRRRDRAAAALRAEARRVYRVAGIEPADLRDDDLTSGFVAHPIPGRAPTGRSTWQSVRRGVPPETDFLNGEIALLARLHGTDAPRNAAVQARLQRAVGAGAGVGSLPESDLAALLPDVDVLVDADGLAAELAGPDAPVLLDVRWALGDPDGHRHHREGHLPGAVYVDLETELAAPPDDPTAGRHPLPDPAALQAAARRWGVRADRPVVLYDATGGLAAGRGWWLLRWGGHPDVRLLDGGLAAWTAVGRPLEVGDPAAPEPGDVVLDGAHLPVLGPDEAAGLAREGLLLDARAGERYRGEVEPVDPRAGHVPGAVSAPTGDNLAPDGTFRPADEQAGRFAALGVGSSALVGVYCGSGVTAAHQIAALAALGVPAALYAGSWSAWSSDPARPLATGPDRGTP